MRQQGLIATTLMLQPFITALGKGAITSEHIAKFSLVNVIKLLAGHKWSIKRNFFYHFFTFLVVAPRRPHSCNSTRLLSRKD
jgi:hypothetical protein